MNKRCKTGCVRPVTDRIPTGGPHGPATTVIIHRLRPRLAMSAAIPLRATRPENRRGRGPRDAGGGTCLNIGCIPSKALLHASHQLHEAEHNFAKMGLKGKSPSVDWKQMLSYKTRWIGQNTKGIEFLFKKNKIDLAQGLGSIPEAGRGQGRRRDPRSENITLQRVPPRPPCPASRSTKRSSSPPRAR